MNQQPQVYIVEDEEGVRQSLDALLSVAGLKTQVFETAADFLAALRNHDRTQPCCLLLDIQLPGLTGLELLAELDHRGEFIPTIMTTGQSDDKLEPLVTQPQVVACFQKPFSPSELLRTVSEVLSNDAEVDQQRKGGERSGSR